MVVQDQKLSGGHDSALKPKLTHAASVWWDWPNVDTSKRLLDCLKGTTLVTMTGAGRSMPRAPLGTKMGLKPFQLTIKETVTKALLTKNNSNKDIIL